MRFRQALCDAGLTIEDIEKFGRWAFGEGWESAGIYRLDDRWKERHGPAANIEPTTSVHEGTKRMVELWEKEGRPG